MQKTLQVLSKSPTWVSPTRPSTYHIVCTTVSLKMKKAPSANPFEDLSGLPGSKTPVKPNALPPPKSAGSNVKKPPMNPFESGIDMPVKATGTRAPSIVTPVSKPVTPNAINVQNCVGPTSNNMFSINESASINSTQVTSFNGHSMNSAVSPAADPWEIFNQGTQQSLATVSSFPEAVTSADPWEMFNNGSQQTSMIASTASSGFSVAPIQSTASFPVNDSLDIWASFNNAGNAAITNAIPSTTPSNDPWASFGSITPQNNINASLDPWNNPKPASTETVDPWATLAVIQAENKEINKKNARNASLAQAQETVNAQRSSDKGVKSDVSLPKNEGGDKLGRDVSTVSRSEKMPIWQRHYFDNLFIPLTVSKSSDDEPVKDKPKVIAGISLETQATTYNFDNLVKSLHEVRDFVATVYESPAVYNEISSNITDVRKILTDACEVFDLFPNRSMSADKFHYFLEMFVRRVKMLGKGGIMLAPVSWMGDTKDSEYAGILVIHRLLHPTTHDFTLTIVNTSNGKNSGTDYHGLNINTADGTFTKNVALEIINVTAARMYNAAFWFMIFKLGIFPNPKHSDKFLYDNILPWISGLPVLCAFDAENAYFAPYHTQDYSYISCVLETLRHIGKLMDLDEVNSKHLPLMVRWSMLETMANDVQNQSFNGNYKNSVKGETGLNVAEIDKMLIATKTMSTFIGSAVQLTSSLTNVQLKCIVNTIDNIHKKLREIDPRTTELPVYNINKDEELPGLAVWNWFGRFRRDIDIETLAGTAPVPPIIRPVEMTLVPDKVSNFNEVAKALRHALNLCVIIANQRDHVRNSYTLRVCLIQHLFIRVIPLPLPFTHPDSEKKCFWGSSPMRYETQADILNLLNQLCKHFAAASLSVKATRSGDAIRILTFSCMATICDVTLRKLACDIPSQSSLHYSGKAMGPVHPFGFELGNFAEESEFLKFTTPEATSARTQVLDYFYSMKKIVPSDNMMFKFHNGNECSAADMKFIDQLCLQMGFKRNNEIGYMTGIQRALLDLYPEIGYFRDLIFMCNLVMVPTSEKLPDLKQWEPHEAELYWQCDRFNYIVTGFGKKLDCTQNFTPPSVGEQIKQVMNKGFFSKFLQYVGIAAAPRSVPSQANPSILLGENVDNEDDILHVKSLPDFDGTMGAKDCELMLQYLTAPYMRIPLLLNFFSSETRINALRNEELQDVLDAALFEPGQFKNSGKLASPHHIPAPTRDHLCTPTGLLFNEIVMSPTIIMECIIKMLKQVIEMDTGVYSELSDCILYVVRLAVRVEAYLLFLVQNFEYQKNINSSAVNGAYAEAQVRGLNCDENTIIEARNCQKTVRHLLEDKLFKIIARWTKRSKDSGKICEACMLHAHLAFIYRNINDNELDIRSIFTMLASQIFLFNNYKYDLDIGKKEKRKRGDLDYFSSDLLIPEVELFDMHQRNRHKILCWLTNNPDLRDIVMDGILHMIEEEKNTSSSSSSKLQHISQSWVPIDKPGLSLVGRFIPKGEFDSNEIDKKITVDGKDCFEDWLRQVTTILSNTEVNVQLGEFTIKKNVIEPLPVAVIAYDDFQTVFKHVSTNDIIQCATIKQTSHRRWLRLVGLGYDLQEWSPDDRNPTLLYKQPYESCKVQWVKNIIEPWKEKMFRNIELFITTDNIADATEVMLQGMVLPTTTPKDDTEQFRLIKEIVVYRYPKVIHVFDVVEYGRRWFRTQVFSSDPVFSFHVMESKGFYRTNTNYVQYCGTTNTDWSKSCSLVIKRDSVPNIAPSQSFIPSKYLYGLLPDALVDKYQFWQNEDNLNIVGYMHITSANSSVARSALFVNITEVGKPDASGFGYGRSRCNVSRVYLADNIVNDKSLNETEKFLCTRPDTSKPTYYLINLFKVFKYYRTQESVGFNDDDQMAHSQAFSSLHQWDKESESLHGLLRLLIRFESLTHILAWTTKDTCDEKTSTISIDIVELPRLQLTFEKKILSDGTVKYYCVEHNGLFISGHNNEHRIADLLDGLPRSILLSNSDNEYFVMLPATAKPSLIKSKFEGTSYIIVSSVTNAQWLSNIEDNSLYLYPIHPSHCFVSSRSVASTLNLLVWRWMNRKYKDTFRLIESCVCDRELTPQEKQIYDLIANITDTVFPDAHACRLKLYFVTYG